MGRRRSYTPLSVFLNTRCVGQLIRESSGAIGFTYDRNWLAWEHRMPVSLSLPLRPERYVGQPVIAVFETFCQITNKAAAASPNMLVRKAPMRSACCQWMGEIV